MAMIKTNDTKKWHCYGCCLNGRPTKDKYGILFEHSTLQPSFSSWHRLERLEEFIMTSGIEPLELVSGWRHLMMKAKTKHDWTDNSLKADHFEHSRMTSDSSHQRHGSVASNPMASNSSYVMNSNILIDQPCIVFGWGCNQFGQLTSNIKIDSNDETNCKDNQHSKDQPSPSDKKLAFFSNLIKQFILDCPNLTLIATSSNDIQISCGSEHSLILLSHSEQQETTQLLANGWNEHGNIPNIKAIDGTVIGMAAGCATSFLLLESS